MARKESREDPRLARLTGVCLALPEATREDQGRHAAFLVRKKTFAYYLDDHHGDGIVAVTGKAPLGENADLVAHDPEKFYLPAYGLYPCIRPASTTGAPRTWPVRPRRTGEKRSRRRHREPPAVKPRSTAPGWPTAWVARIFESSVF